MPCNEEVAQLKPLVREERKVRGMYSINDFIRWALTHVKPDSVPARAVLPAPVDDCGAEPWHYLFGTVRAKTTAAKLEERWTYYYSKHGWTRSQYDAATEGWSTTDYATDCQGLLDAYLTYVQGENTDINAHMNYMTWCEHRGKIIDINRPYIIGEALFMRSAAGRMTHVGWICGFDVDGEPLVLEARGLRYGVVITRLESRPWTHRGLMTKKFSYEESEENSMTKFEVTSPMRTGSVFKQMQRALNSAGYTDAEGGALAEDGKWGKKSQQAFDKLLSAHGQASCGDIKCVLEVRMDGKAIYSREV